MEPNQFASFDSIQDDAQSLYRMALGFAGRVRGVSSLLFWATVVTGLAALIFGLLALSGTWRILWFVFGGTGVLFGISASFRLRSGVRAIIDHATELQTSIAGLLGGLTDAVSAHELAESDDDGFVKRAKKARNFRKAAKDSLSKYKDVANAISTIATFPAVALSAIGFTIGYGILAVIFGVALLF